MKCTCDKRNLAINVLEMYEIISSKEVVGEGADQSNFVNEGNFWD